MKQEMRVRRVEGSRSFRTRMGEISLSWTARGISRLSLPRGRSRSLPTRRGALPPAAARLMRAVQAYFRGEESPLRARLDLSGLTAFQRDVYRAARSIPPGEVRTYGEIARAIGRPRAARAVGSALGRNPIPLLIPCHRVVSSSDLGGFSAPGGISLKRRMLALESGGRRRRPTR